MRVHHLNCGTMRPPRTPDGLVCHVLLIETATSLVLVDTGLGCGREPGKWFGPARHFVRPAFDPAEAAVRQVAALGFDADDVSDIVLTHFDADHTGGLPDFPRARVHLTAAENQASLHPRGPVEKGRYLPIHRDHDPVVVEHAPAAGEAWRGFARAVELSDIAPGIVLIALPGHTRGHAAVAVQADAQTDRDAGGHWVVHVGDSFYHHGQVDGTGRVPKALRAMERAVAHDWEAVRANHARLAELWAASEPDLLLVNAHDPTLLARARGRAQGKGATDDERTVGTER